MSDTEKRWRKAVFMATLIGLIDIALLLLGTKAVLHLALSIASMGIITFFGILLLVNRLSGSTILDRGEMRKAIAGSFIVVYFSIVGLLIFNGTNVMDTTLAKTIIGHFTYVVGIIIVFYFGSAGVREYLKYKKENNHSSTDDSITK